jgi:hypothetical protein
MMLLIWLLVLYYCCCVCCRGVVRFFIPVHVLAMVLACTYSINYRFCGLLLLYGTYALLLLRLIFRSCGRCLLLLLLSMIFLLLKLLFLLLLLLILRLLLRLLMLVAVLRIRDPGSGAFFDPWIRDPGWVESQPPDLG